MVEVQVRGIEKTKGSLWVALMESPEAFVEGAPDISKIIPVVKTEKKLIIDALKPGGVYALCVFHDVDNDGKLDKGIFGNPTEPYAFSNNARRVFSMPKFDEAAFSVPERVGERAVQIIELR